MLPTLEQIGRAPRPRILVLGDLMLDQYVWGNAERVSPEAPVLVLRADKDEIRLGGAASVAGLLRRLGAEVTVAGVVGHDAAGRQLRTLFAETDIDSTCVLEDPGRPTTTKERYFGRASGRHASQVLRVDRESCTPLKPPLEEQLARWVGERLPNVDALLISDYAKGVCTPALLASVMQVAQDQNVPVIVDPGRIGDYSKYRGARVVMPNRSEAELVTGRAITSEHDAFAAAQALREGHGFPAVIVKLDRQGMVLATADGGLHRFPARTRWVYDVTGAGDMALAVMGYTLATGIDLAQGVSLANVAAGLEVERHGVTPLTWKEIAAETSGRDPTAKVVTLPEMLELAREYRRTGQRLVFTNGCFDLLHPGHVSCLQEAAALEDVLVVALNSDASVRRLKGPSRPILRQDQRAAMVAAIEGVDHVLIFDEDTPHRLLEQLRPEVLAKGGTTPQIVGRELVESYGGRVARLSSVAGLSTTAIVAALGGEP